MIRRYEVKSLGFAVTREVLDRALYGQKEWGRYRRGGRVFWRNYRREVRGGLTYSGMLIERFGPLKQQTDAAMEKNLATRLY